MSGVPSLPRRFEIALSFPGEHRGVVEQVATLLAKEFTQERILYDNFHDAEFAAPDLDIYLPPLYHRDSELIVLFLCPEYAAKRWCRLEWRHVRQMLATAGSRRIMFLGFGKLGEIPELGILEGDGKIDITDLPPEIIAQKIIKRLHLNRSTSSPPSMATPPAVGKATPSVLPIQPSNLPGGYIGQVFLGRDEFLETLHQSLTGGHATAITQKAATGISGLGGIGKTHAAVEYAHRHRANYNALLFVSGDTPENLNSSLAGLCEVLRLGDLPSDESIRMRVVLDWLAGHPGWLMIIDNVDDEPAALALTALLGQLTTGHILITSRLHHWSRQVKTLDLSVLSEDAATELILELTVEHRRIAADDEMQARELAGLLDGLPLAIQQAAGFINEQTITLADYISRFHAEAADLLNWFSTNIIPYAGPTTSRPEDIAPRPVLITWKTSFDKLSEDDRSWLLVFAHFGPEPIPEFLLRPTDDAVPEQKAILREANDAIVRAGKYSLVTRSRSEPFFKIHRLVQQITRLHAAGDECFTALEIAICIIAAAESGSPTDVRSWQEWIPLQPHSVALCNHASDESPPANLAWLAGELGVLFKLKARYKESEIFSRRALKIDRAAYGDHHPEVVVRLSNLAQLLKDTSQLSEAESLMREGLRIERSIREDDHPNVGIQSCNLAGLLRDTHRMSEAEPLMRDALRIFRAAYGSDHPQVATALNELALLLKDISQMTEAELLMREALRIDCTAYRGDHPRVAIRLSNLASLLQATDRLSEAEPLMREALRIDRAAYGDDHPRVATQSNNLASLLGATNRLSEAETLMREALRIDRAAYGDDHPDVGTDLHNLASLLKVTNRLSEAEPLMREAIRIDRAAYGNDHPRVATKSNNLASLLQATNRLSEAEPLMRDALRIDRAAYGDDHPKIAIRLNNLAGLLQDTNLLSEAEPLMRDALRILHGSLGPEHPNTMTVANNLEILLKEMADLPPDEVV